MNVSIYEMLEQVSKQKAKKDKIDLLRKYANENQALKIIIDLTFNPSWTWLLPEGAPPYTAQPREADVQNVLKNQARRLQYFVNTPDGNRINKVKRETMFIEFLESLDEGDAKLIISAKDKKLPFRNLTKNLIKEAFPDETQNW